MADWTSFMDSTPLGGFFDSGSNAKKAGGAAVNDAAGQYGALTPPTFTPVQQQTAQQQTAQAQSAGPSAYGGISTNPAYTQAQTQQMQALSKLAANGGRSAASDANLAQIQQQENANNRGQQQAILQGAAQRGQSGSGTSLLAALSAQQGGIDRQNAQDLGVAGQQAQTAISAGQGAAGIGSNLENQAFGEAATKAGAQDAMSRFNAGQGTQVNEFNAGQGNNIGEFNAGQGNQISALNNYTMPQASYQDSLERARGIAGADQTAASFDTGQQDRAAKKQGQLWNSAFNAGGDLMGGSNTGADPSSVASVMSNFAQGGLVMPKAAPAPVSGLGGITKNAVSNPTNKEAMLSALGNLRKKAMGARV
jgi:hypothetical protein